MRRLFACTAAVACLSASAVNADAACKRLGFTVNDYGKDGPTKDAKSLLDGYIARWAQQNNIKKYTTGKKDVSCELFLDFGAFDEHTCKASANVCWDGPKLASEKAGKKPVPKATKANAAAPAKPAPKPAT